MTKNILLLGKRYILEYPRQRYGKDDEIRTKGLKPFTVTTSLTLDEKPYDFEEDLGSVKKSCGEDSLRCPVQ